MVDLFSISKNKLIGVENKFSERFSINETENKNLGNEIDPFTYIVFDPSVGIVAFEKFSNTYIKLNTYKPYIIMGGTYLLSDYSSDWGWPLVLPDDFEFSDIGKYYIFYEYIPSYDDTLIGGIIDYDNEKTEVSKTFVIKDYSKTLNYMFLDTLYQSLSIINQ